MILRCKLKSLYLARNHNPEPITESSSNLARQLEAEGDEWIILEVISRELRIRKMLIKLRSISKVVDIINHLKETFKMLNTTDYYIKEVVDKQNLDCELNKELNNRMPLSNLTSKLVLLCKKQYADAPTVTPKLAKAFTYEQSNERAYKKKPSQDMTRKPKQAGNELVSVK